MEPPRASLVAILKKLEPRADATWLPRSLFPIVLLSLERRYQRRPLPKKALALNAQTATEPWRALLALAAWLERREPQMSGHVAEHFAAVERVVDGAPEFDVGASLRIAVRQLRARRLSRGKPKATAGPFSEEQLRAFYEGLYEDFDAVEQRAKSVGWAVAINGQFGIYGEDRAPSPGTLRACEEYDRKQRSRSELCLQITADLGNRSVATLANWKSLRELPPNTLTRHPKPRKTPLRAE